MLPLVDKPNDPIRGVEEALALPGANNIIHRDRDAARTPSRIASTSTFELETFLEARGKNELLEEIRKISKLNQRVSPSARENRSGCKRHAVIITQPTHRPGTVAPSF